MLSLSTASNLPYTRDTFKQEEHDGFSKAIRHVRVKEINMDYLKNDINSGKVQPHLSYTLEPFLVKLVSEYMEWMDIYSNGNENRVSPIT